MEEELGILEDKNELVETPDDHSSFSCDETDPEGDIDGLSNYNIILEYPELQFDFSELLGFNDEVKDWFAVGEIKMIKSISQIGQLSPPLSSLSSIINGNNDGQILKALIQLTYKILGDFNSLDCETLSSENELKNKMLKNVEKVIDTDDIIQSLCYTITTRSHFLSDIDNFKTEILSDHKLDVWSMQFFYAMTTLNIIILVFNTHEMKQSDKIIKDINDAGIMVNLLKSLDQWKLASAKLESKNASTILSTMASSDSKHQNEKYSIKLLTSFKIRNVIILLNNLILLLFGNLEHLKSTKDFLEFKFESNTNDNQYSISSMDYEYYKSELLIRYPTFTPKKYEASEIIRLTANQSNEFIQSELDDNDISSDTESISDILNVNSLLINQHQHLKNNKQINGLTMNNDPPDIHIATPMPSPTLTPQHTGNSRNYSKVSELKHPTSEAKKKLYVTQANYPNICPHDNEPPQSIKDATDLFYHRIKDDFNTQQFISTFEQFIEKEHSILTKFNDKFVYSNEDIKSNPMFAGEIESLQRVELFYSKSISYFNSLIYILLQVLSSNTIPTQQTHEDGQTRQRQVNTKSEDDQKPYLSQHLSIFEKQKLEINRMKETMLKSASSILLLLQEWFKLSHVLKFEYFTSLIYDQDFSIQLFRYLDSNKIQSQANGGFDLKEPESLLNNRIVYCDYLSLYELEEYDIFKTILKLNNPNYEIKEPLTREQQLHQIYGDENDFSNKKSTPLSFILPFVPQTTTFTIKSPNLRSCIIMSNLFQSMNHLVSNYKLQRIYKLLDIRPTEILRFYLMLHNENIFQPILSIIKTISPFIGKKWRSNNMDLISFVYLFHKIEIKDIWLNNIINSSIEDKVNKSFDNEFALRCLIKFYNFENYGGIGFNDEYIDEFLNEVDKYHGDFFLKGCFELNN